MSWMSIARQFYSFGSVRTENSARLLDSCTYTNLATILSVYHITLIASPIAPVMSLFPALFSVLRALFIPRLELTAENLALRQQLAVLHPTAKPPKLRPQDRLFWTTLSRLWKDWRSACSSSNRRRSSNGTAKAFSFSGDGRQSFTIQDGRRSVQKSASSFTGCHGRIPSGTRLASKQSYSYSGSTSPSPLWPNTGSR